MEIFLDSLRSMKEKLGTISPRLVGGIPTPLTNHGNQARTL